MCKLFFEDREIILLNPSRKRDDHGACDHAFKIRDTSPNVLSSEPTRHICTTQFLRPSGEIVARYGEMTKISQNKLLTDHLLQQSIMEYNGGSIEKRTILRLFQICVSETMPNCGLQLEKVWMNGCPLSRFFF